MNHIRHVAIIMDGNGRWGIKHKKSRNLGHREGLKIVEKVIKATIKNKIKFLTLYAFSTENWKRPKKEINFLFNLLENFLLNKITDLNKQNIKLKIIGKKNFSRKINNLLNSKNYDIRIIGDARFMDQKVTPDVLCIIADCVVNLNAKYSGKPFTKDDIWELEYFNKSVKSVIIVTSDKCYESNNSTVGFNFSTFTVTGSGSLKLDL